MSWDTPRRTALVVHHTTANSNSTEDFTDVCSSTQGAYDFQIMANGDIIHGYRKSYSTGCHGNTACNCNTTGVALQGCFGSSDSFCNNKGNLYPTTAQSCSLGYIWHNTGIPAGDGYMKPHRWCRYGKPCGSSTTGTATVCPGTRLTSSSSSSNYWSSWGLDWRSQVNAKRNQYSNCGSCACV